MDWVANLALGISCGALALEVRRWVESGPQLHLSVINDGWYSGEEEENKYIFVTATNRGSAPTTIRYMTLNMFDSWLSVWRGRPSWTAACLHPSPWLSVISLEIGTNKTWHGGALYNQDLEDKVATGKLYVGVIASHRDKIYYKRVRPTVALPGKADN